MLSGYNGTIFAYGQTSSGKTHTMEVCVAEVANLQLAVFLTNFDPVWKFVAF